MNPIPLIPLIIEAVKKSKVEGMIEIWIHDPRDGDGEKEILDKQDISVIDVDRFIQHLKEVMERE